MTSVLFNPITVTLAAMAAIVMLTAFVPVDLWERAWKRIKDAPWYFKRGMVPIEPPPREWPWEKH